MGDVVVNLLFLTRSISENSVTITNVYLQVLSDYDVSSTKHLPPSWRQQLSEYSSLERIYDNIYNKVCLTIVSGHALASHAKCVLSLKTAQFLVICRFFSVGLDEPDPLPLVSSVSVQIFCNSDNKCSVIQHWRFAETRHVIHSFIPAWGHQLPVHARRVFPLLFLHQNSLEIY